MIELRLKRGRARSGLSLLELVLVFGVMLVLFGLTHALLKFTIGVWWRVNAGADAQQQIHRAHAHLERDLKGAGFSLEGGRRSVDAVSRPAHLNSLAGSDGDVLWFLSALDPLSGEFQRMPDGSPFWQRNVIYYLVTPQELTEFGFTGSGYEADGYEVGCPHKVLLRICIDSGVPTSPSTEPETSRERLLSPEEVFGLLQRPLDRRTMGMSGPTHSVIPVAIDILSFRVDLIADLRAVEIDLISAPIAEVRGLPNYGARDLSEEAATLHVKRLFFPPNRAQFAH